MRLKDPRVLWPLGEGLLWWGRGRVVGRMNVQSLAGMRVRPTPAFQPLWPWEPIGGLAPRGYWVERSCEGKHWTLG